MLFNKGISSQIAYLAAPVFLFPSHCFFSLLKLDLRLHHFYESAHCLSSWCYYIIRKVFIREFCSPLDKNHLPLASTRSKQNNYRSHSKLNVTNNGKLRIRIMGGVRQEDWMSRTKQTVVSVDLRQLNLQSTKYSDRLLCNSVINTLCTNNTLGFECWTVSLPGAVTSWNLRALLIFSSTAQQEANKRVPPNVTLFLRMDLRSTEKRQCKKTFAVPDKQLN